MPDHAPSHPSSADPTTPPDSATSPDHATPPGRTTPPDRARPDRDLIDALVAGEPTAGARILDRVADLVTAPTTDAAADAAVVGPALLVAAAVLTAGRRNGRAASRGDGRAGSRGSARRLLDLAAGAAVTTRDRQLVAIAAAHLDGDTDRRDAYLQDHLVEHADSALLGWLVATVLPSHDSGRTTS